MRFAQRVGGGVKRTSRTRGHPPTHREGLSFQNFVPALSYVSAYSIALVSLTGTKKLVAKEEKANFKIVKLLIDILDQLCPSEIQQFKKWISDFFRYVNKLSGAQCSPFCLFRISLTDRYPTAVAWKRRQIPTPRTKSATAPLTL